VRPAELEWDQTPPKSWGRSLHVFNEPERNLVAINSM